MSENSKKSYKISKLTGDNYHIWSHQMKLILRAKGAYEMIKNAEEGDGETEPTIEEKEESIKSDAMALRLL